MSINASTGTRSAAVQHTYALWMDVAALGLRQLAGLRVLAVVDERDTGRVLGLLGLGGGSDALCVGAVHLRPQLPHQRGGGNRHGRMGP